MKKLIILLVALLCVFTVVGCGKKDGGDTTDPVTKDPETVDSGNSSGDSYNSKAKWIEAKAYNSPAGEDLPIMVRLLEITKDMAKIDPQIASYKGIYDLSTKPEYTDWVLIVCEQKWPEGSPSGEFGLYKGADVRITDIESRKAGSVKYRAAGYYAIQSIETEKPETMQPGEAYIIKVLTFVPEGMPVEDMAVAFGTYSEYVIVNIKGEILPPKE